MRVVIAKFADQTNATRFLEASCNKHSIDYITYGEGLRWNNWYEAKVTNHIPFLESIDDGIVLFSDGFDSLMLRDEIAIMQTYESFGSDIVIAANRSPMPMPQLKDRFEAETSFKYICAGQYMGKREAIITALKQHVDKNCVKGSDQSGWAKTHLSGEVDMIIDTHCQLFLTMVKVDLDELTKTEQGYKLEETGTYPCAIHFGGPKGGSLNGLQMKEFYTENGYGD